MLGSSSCELGFSFRVSRDRVGPFACASGRLPWGFVPLRGVSAASPHVRRASRLALVPPTAFRTLSTAYSSLYLAGLFRPAATSRILLRGSSPDLAVPPRRWPLTSRRWRRVSVADCSTTPSRVASTSGLCSRPGSAASNQLFRPALRPCPVALVSFGLSLSTLPPQ